MVERWHHRWLNQTPQRIVNRISSTWQFANANGFEKLEKKSQKVQRWECGDRRRCERVTDRPRLKFPGNKTNTSWTIQTDRPKRKAVEKVCSVSSTGRRKFGRIELRLYRWVKTIWEELRRGRWEELKRSEKSWEELRKGGKDLTRGAKIVENKKTNSENRVEKTWGFAASPIAKPCLWILWCNSPSFWKLSPPASRGFYLYTVPNSLQPRILYTCSAQDEPDHETASHALDLAHRWQVEVVVAILTDLLAGAQKSFGVFWSLLKQCLPARISTSTGQVHLPFPLTQPLRYDHGRKLFGHCGACCPQGRRCKQNLTTGLSSFIAVLEVNEGMYGYTADDVLKAETQSQKSIFLARQNPATTCKCCWRFQLQLTVRYSEKNP